MPGFETIIECPVHKKALYIKVTAANVEMAKKKVLSSVVNCPLEPTHKFVAGFRAGEKEILGVYPLAWLPTATEEGVVSDAPSLTPIKAIEPTPLETMYYINPVVAEKQMRKSDWWER